MRDEEDQDVTPRVISVDVYVNVNSDRFRQALIESSQGAAPASDCYRQRSVYAAGTGLNWAATCRSPSAISTIISLAKVPSSSRSASTDKAAGTSKARRSLSALAGTPLCTISVRTFSMLMTRLASVLVNPLR